MLHDKVAQILILTEFITLREVPVGAVLHNSFLMVMYMY